MTYEDFLPGIERLALVFRPTAWSEAQAMEYYQVFQHWSESKWNQAVGTALFQHKSRMPTPAHLREYGGESDSKGQGNVPVRGLLAEEGCEHCERGMVRFEIVKDGLRYDKFAACDCAAGDRVARHIVQVGKLQGLNLNMQHTRYHAVMPRESAVPF